MNPPPGHRTTRVIENACRRAFTLIELILVMAILVIVVGISLPRLKTFFRGRNLESESRRLLELTRYAQSRAVSEGVPMVVWIDPKRSSYGMNEEAGYTEGDTKAVSYHLDPNLSVSVVQGRIKSALKTSLPTIHFLPENVVGPNSVNAVCLQDGTAQPVWLVQSADGARYEIRTQYNARVTGR